MAQDLEKRWHFCPSEAIFLFYKMSPLSVKIGIRRQIPWKSRPREVIAIQNQLKDGRWFFSRLLLVAGICFGCPNSFRPRCSKTYEGRPKLSLTIGEKRNCSPALLDENEGKENIETKRREIRVRLKVIIESFNRISLISIFAKIEWHIG